MDVTIGITGFNPYRISQFENHGSVVKAGMSEAAAENYLGAIEASLNSPNMVLDLRIPQNQRYQQIVLDTAIHALLAGETEPDEAIAEIVTGWDEITEELGQDDQLAAYKASLGRDQVAVERTSVAAAGRSSAGGGTAASPVDGERLAPAVFILPAVLVVLVLSIFPLIVSLYLSLSRFKLAKGGFTVDFIGTLNFQKLLFGSQQFHLLGKLVPLSPAGLGLRGAGGAGGALAGGLRPARAAPGSGFVIGRLVIAAG